MGFCKDQLIRQMQEEREDLEATIDEIEAYGGRLGWYVRREPCNINRLEPLINSTLQPELR